MNILVGCEYSATVARAFRDKGHAVSTCDLLPSEDKSIRHFQYDIMQVIEEEPWDLIILHPPCTHLAVSGNRWYAGTKERENSLWWTVGLFEKSCINSRRVAMENPVGVISTWRKPDQYIQPWQFGHGETKKTGLWLHNLPKLKPTNIVDGREPRIHHMSPGKDRGKERSRFYTGIAEAMANQWSVTNAKTQRESTGHISGMSASRKALDG